MSESGRLRLDGKNRILKIVGLAFGTLLILVLAYLLYVVSYYHRIPDHQPLDVVVNSERNAVEGLGETEGGRVTVGEEYTIVTYNVGFGAYSPDFSFFMDGGKKSWAASRESAAGLINGAGNLSLSFEPDFVLLQEIDVDSTRTYHLNELELLAGILKGYDYTFAVNYDSAFLMYPINEPHGASNAGLATFSRYGITSAERRSLPVSNSFSKLVDLDRCYSINRIPVDNGKELVIINIHMSAYGSSEAVRTGQTSMLREDMAKEYSAGNYVIVGGDYNHNLKLLNDDGNTGWAHAYDRTLIPEGFTFAIDLCDADTRDKMHDTCRDAGTVYLVNATPTVTLDGFIISDNVKCIEYVNSDNGYEYSDHDPVVMKFILE